MESIEKLQKDGCEVYLPVQSSKSKKENNFKPQKMKVKNSKIGVLESV